VTCPAQSDIVLQVELIVQVLRTTAWSRYTSLVFAHWPFEDAMYVPLMAQAPEA
jgi:hypothetical protein